MTIKQQGGVFGRNPTFHDVEADLLDLNGPLQVDAAGSYFQLPTSTNSRAFYVKQSNDYGYSFNLDSQSTGDLMIKAVNNGVETDLIRASRVSGHVTIANNLIISNAGAGIDFSATPGTGTSELFDDYEEGTWTPVVADAATGGNLCTMSGPIYTFGSYTKVGRMVHIQGSIRITGVTGVTTTNVAYITGLPFTPDASQNTLTGGYVTRANYIDTPAGCVNLGLFVRTDGSMMVTTAVDSGVAATLTIANIQSINANHFLAFNAAYYV